MPWPVTPGLLASFGYDADKVAAERAKIAAFDAANQAQEAAKGSAQQDTQDQDATLAAMNDWTAQYLKITKVAPRSKKQALEKIGATARTSKTAAQRAAPKKAAATRAAKKKVYDTCHSCAPARVKVGAHEWGSEY